MLSVIILLLVDIVKVVTLVYTLVFTLINIVTDHIVLELNQVKDPQLPPPGGPPAPGGGGLYFEIRWVMATFLNLLSSNLVCKPYFGLNLNLWSQIPPLFWGPSGGGGLYFGGGWVVA